MALPHPERWKHESPASSRPTDDRRAELKTIPNDRPVEDFLRTVEPADRREDCRVLIDLMSRETDAPPRMWGSGIIGFGDHRYRYESGREGDWFLVGFSPRKKDFSLYLWGGFPGRSDFLARLGKHRTGSSCVYVRRLSEIDLEVLREMVRASIQNVRNPDRPEA